MFVIAAGLVGGSFQILEPNTYGILRNSITSTVDRSYIYTSGRFFGMLGHNFVTYPRTQQTITFGAGGDAAALSIQIVGGTVQMECTLQYMLNASSLFDTYAQFGTTYNARYISFISSALQQGFTSQLNITDFYQSRQTVAAIALSLAQGALSTKGANVVGLQIGAVTLPASNEAQIVTKLTTQQASATAQNVQAANQINAQINVLVGQINQEIALFLANETQIATVLVANANSYARQIQLTSKALAYASYAPLGLNQTQFLHFLYLKNLRNANPKSNLAFGFNSVSKWH